MNNQIEGLKQQSMKKRCRLTQGATSMSADLNDTKNVADRRGIKEKKDKRQRWQRATQPSRRLSALI